ncbi:uncharacterized protein LOC110348202 isoform X1 [Heterocephalus glaber]|uniref:Uncharacterized protein LOC110348202 isoform X1 n=1 Tax=Heterocephalus glaber TaxID=10181 RepID=A0AAX6SJV3_HETGA|nr:uncharacterized protein LOC110348202 isoform X1 [Heterocephalus glaber]
MRACALGRLGRGDRFPPAGSLRLLRRGERGARRRRGRGLGVGGGSELSRAGGLGFAGRGRSAVVRSPAPCGVEPSHCTQGATEADAGLKVAPPVKVERAQHPTPRAAAEVRTGIGGRDSGPQPAWPCPGEAAEEAIKPEPGQAHTCEDSVHVSALLDFSFCICPTPAHRPPRSDGADFWGTAGRRKEEPGMT